MNYLLLRDINFTLVGIVIAIVAVLAIVFAVLIVLVSKACAVKEDEKAKAVGEYLSGANCGGCGYAGCADFAKALSEGNAEINGCSATSNENKAEIALRGEAAFKGNLGKVHLGCGKKKNCFFKPLGLDVFTDSHSRCFFEEPVKIYRTYRNIFRHSLKAEVFGKIAFNVADNRINCPSFIRLEIAVFVLLF